MSNDHELRLAFTGPAEHGKSTSTNHVIQQVGGQEMMFSKALKDITAEILQFSDEQKRYMYESALKKQIIPGFNTSARRLLQVIGTELFREALFKEIPELQLEAASPWIHNVAKRLANAPKSSNVVVSDCRFDDEYQFLKSKGFTVIKIRDPRKEQHT